MKKAIEVIRDSNLWQIIGFAVAIKILALAVGYALLGAPHTDWMGHTISDIWYWVGFWQKTQGIWKDALGQKLIPYVDFDYVYPPLSGLLYWFIGRFIDLSEGQWKSIILNHGIFMSIPDIVNAGLIYVILKEINAKRAVLLSYLFVASLTALVLTPVRYESYVVTFVLVGYLLHRHNQPLWGTVVWSLGCWLKWYPIFFILAEEIRAFTVDKKRNRWQQTVAVFVAIAALLNVPFMIACQAKNGNLNNWWITYAFHANREISWDTLFGAVRLWVGNLQLEGLANNITVILITLAIVLRQDLKVEYKGTIICAAALFCNRIYSPQFNLWFYPLLMFVIAQETRKRWLLLLGLYLVLDISNIVVFPFSFADAIIEMKGFGDQFAAKSGGLATWIFTGSIVLRAALLAVISGLLITSHPVPDDKSKQLTLFE